MHSDPRDTADSGPETRNVDPHTVAGFGDEWQAFDQTALDESELDALFERYFHLFPWRSLPGDAQGFDLGCGSGRWAERVAPRVARLHCIDASEQALAVARTRLAPRGNCEFHCATVAETPLAPASMDFGYSLGVLHHVPDTAADIRRCATLLKPGAPLLLYLYYAFDNRAAWYRGLWRVSDLLRRGVSRLPFALRRATCNVLALGVYLPLARFAALAERAGANVASLPLSSYRHLSFYTMRTDALDRFGTRLEQRFTRDQIRSMLEQAGMTDIQFSEREPFWCVLARRAA